MLKQRALSATLWSAIEQIGANGLSMIFMLVFARHLSAEEFGIFSAATIFTGLVSTFALLGLNTVVVQRPGFDIQALSTAFWIVFLAAVIVAGALATFALSIAGLFGNPDIALIMPIMAIGIVVSAASVMVSAPLRRALQIQAIARCTLLASVASGVIATPFILNGFGAWGLVVQMVGGSVLTLLLMVLINGWPFRWEFDGRVAREMLRLGAPVMGADLLSYYNKESPKIFVAFFLGVEALGIFVMAMRVMTLLQQVIGMTLTKVILPLMSEVNRTTPERKAEIYLRLVRLASVIILPMFLLVAVLGEPFVQILLGPAWVEIVPIMSLLCVAGLLTTFNYINSDTLVALGYSNARLLFSTIYAVVGTILFLIGVSFGPVAVAAAFLLRSIIVEPIQLIYLLRCLELSAAQYFGKMHQSGLAALVMVVIGIGVMLLLTEQPALLVLIVAGSIAVVAYGLVLLLVDKCLIIELRGLLAKHSNAL